MTSAVRLSTGRLPFRSERESHGLLVDAKAVDL